MEHPTLTPRLIFHPSTRRDSATAATRLPLDAVQEVTVISSTSDADLGQNAGSVMNATIKSGTNTFHGSLYKLTAMPLLMQPTTLRT